VQSGGGTIAGRSPTMFLADAGTPSIHRHRGQWHARNIAKWPGEVATGGARLDKCNGRSAPERWAGESPCPPVGPLDNRSTSRIDWRAKQQAAAGSLAPWHTCRNTGWDCDGGTRSLTGPWARETPGPPLDTAGRSADISVVFLFSYRGRLKWSHLHCQPDAVASGWQCTRRHKHLPTLPPITQIRHCPLFRSVHASGMR